MVLERRIIAAIENKFGQKINRPSLFDALAQHILEVTGESLGTNTLKRLFGTIDGVEPRPATLDVIARYIGYECWNELLLITENRNSAFTPSKEILSVKDLNPGKRLVICYEPKRNVKLEVTENGWCRVISVTGGKLMEGDLLNIVAVVRHFPFEVSEVIRNGVSLGPYKGGIEGGVTSFRFEQ